MAFVSGLDGGDIEVTPAQAREMIEQGAQLVDVREPYEWDVSRIAGARHIPLEQLPSQADTIERGQPVIFQCRSGVRSAMAADAFRAAGYDAWSMSGGLVRWHAEELPLDPAGAGVAEH